ncbi:MAG: tRNA guanosine(34) transglycosylase Tgt [Candidatus Pacearchaeota archaeon]
MKTLEVRGKILELPAFLPDATFGCVRGVSIEDLNNTGIRGLVVNTYHLFKLNLIDEISKNGIGDYIDFSGVVISDSGGFQVMSLIRELRSGKIDDSGVTFTFDNRKIIFTPENCIKLQFLIGSDVIMCLDDCTYPNLSFEEQRKSVERTILWAARCKREFDKLIKNLNKNERPLIFGIIQGGNNFELRKKCAYEIIKLNFDGYAFGGWPVEKGVFLKDILKYVAELIPKEKIKYAMGVGKPEDIVFCVNSGYTLFDCVIPTREARNNRLYTFKRNIFGNMKKLNERGSFYEYVRIRNMKNKENKNPISKVCDCYACNNFSRADIYRFFKSKNPEGVRLSTIHNLRFYSMLMERFRKDK